MYAYIPLGTNKMNNADTNEMDAVDTSEMNTLNTGNEYA